MKSENAAAKFSIFNSKKRQGAKYPCLRVSKKMALMLYLTDFSTASKMLNLNNPIQETVRFRSVGAGITILLSVLKGRDI